MPAVVGGGRGDVEEVLLVGRSLARARHRVQIVRRSTLPFRLDRSYDMEGIGQTHRLEPRHEQAVTISSQFGITAADGRDEPLGRPGPWAAQRAEIDRAYGPGRVLHISLEEFARGRPVGALAEERWREAGRTDLARRARRASRSFRREVGEFVGLYRKFRALEVPNLLPLFPTFRRSSGFAREFPEAVQTGPLWPERRRMKGRRPAARPLQVLWYASPSTSDRLGPRLLAGLERSPRRVLLRIRSPRPLHLPSSDRVRVAMRPPRSPVEWRREWAAADLAIVTGTRSLLEAIDAGVGFLYFNGVMGRGRSARRHRPEKIAALLDLLRRMGAGARVRRDLSDFARLRRVEPIVERSVAHPTTWGASIRRSTERGFPEPFGDGLRTIANVVDRFASGGRTAEDLVRTVRRESRRRGPTALARASKV